jgi:hypothetical protein
MAILRDAPPERVAARARTRILYEAWAGAALFAALAGRVAMVSPEQPGHYPRCPFRALTGLYCPGCGSLRALHDLTHGHVLAALEHNALFVAVLPVAVAAWLRVVTGRTSERALPRWAGLAVLAMLVVWTVVRNLPPLRGLLSAP